ncbi:MAG: zinc ABC transporter substrate-binding protein [Clostridia bacterium]|nr:zinc ABC transporter substrate-binding protein [Clostridia bacterium]
MKTIKRCLALLLVLAVPLLAGCDLMAGAGPEDTRVMASFYPLYALALNLTKDVPALTLGCLVQPQTGCPRSYQLSDWDAALAAGQDALIIGGRGLESFESALKGAEGGPAVLTVLNGLTLYNSGEAASDESSHLAGDNPWLFLSVPGAMEMCISIAAGMAQLDEPYADIYMDNLAEYLTRLEDLADDMENAMARTDPRPVAVLHEGLGYLARQLGLDIVLEYPREPGSDPYGNDLEDLLAALEASGAEVALVERQAPGNLVKAIEAAGCAVVRLDTLMTHAADGDTAAYERAMLDNAKAVAAAMKEDA